MFSDTTGKMFGLSVRTQELENSEYQRHSGSMKLFPSYFSSRYKGFRCRKWIKDTMEEPLCIIVAGKDDCFCM